MDADLRELERRARREPVDPLSVRAWADALARAGDTRASLRALAWAARSGDASAGAALREPVPGLREIRDRRGRRAKKRLETRLVRRDLAIVEADPHRTGASDADLRALGTDLGQRWSARVARGELAWCGRDVLLSRKSENNVELELRDGATGAEVARATVPGWHDVPRVDVCGDRAVISWSSYDGYGNYNVRFMVVDVGEHFGRVIVPSAKPWTGRRPVVGGHACFVTRERAVAVRLDGGAPLFESEDPLPRSAVCVTDGRTLVALGTDRAASVCAATGRTLWSVPRDSLGIAHRFYSPVTSSASRDLIEDELVLARDVCLVARKKADANYPFTTKFVLEDDDDDDDGLGSALAQPTVVAAIDRATGRALWHHAEPSNALGSVVASDDVFYLSWNPGPIEARDAATGHVLWTIDGAVSVAPFDGGILAITSEEVLTRVERLG